MSAFKMRQRSLIYLIILYFVNFSCANPQMRIDLNDVRATIRRPICRVPSDLHHYMIFKKHPYNETIEAGSYLDEFETVNMECTNQFTFRGPPSTTCLYSGWKNSFGICIPPVECSHNSWVCDNGQCISLLKLCDSQTDCSDGSDESLEYCFKESGYTVPYTNKYVTIRPYIATVAPPKIVEGCIIPKLQNMIFMKHPRNETIDPGSTFENFEIVNIDCKNKYTLRGHTSLLCRNGMWNTEFPSCVGNCDASILHGVSITSICEYRSEFGKCPENILPGTTIQISCAYGYKRTPNVYQYLNCLEDGTLDKNPMPCKQNCGIIASSSATLSRNGFRIEPIKAPWHVSIFQHNSVDYVYICSGSIISPRIVITAAHCFWDMANLERDMPTKYQIIAGRSTSNYLMQDDKSHIVQVSQIHIPVRYRGREFNQRHDIAFLKLSNALKYTVNIAPICIPDAIHNSASSYVLPDQEVFLTAFGLNNQLETLKMMTLPHHECLNKIPPDANLADDKFCIYDNDGSSVCRGDSGAGFFKKEKHDDAIIHRLLGVVSNTPATRNDCTPNDAYVAVTNISDMPLEFRQLLANAIIEDEALF